MLSLFEWLLQVPLVMEPEIIKKTKKNPEILSSATHTMQLNSVAISLFSEVSDNCNNSGSDSHIYKNSTVCMEPNWTKLLITYLNAHQKCI